MKSALIAAMAIVTLAAACAQIAPRTPPPANVYRGAVLPGFENARVWADAAPTNFDVDGDIDAVLSNIDARAQRTGQPPQMNILALSGGAADGAFGAGLLSGWTARGDRPELDVVTGISTGALIAPFAFLGSDYDAVLERFFTQTSTDDVVELTLFRALRGGLSLGDSSPLRGRIGEAVDDEMLKKIAAAHRSGRRLFVGTTNLDARRPVIWDLGAIAARETPLAFDLFRDVMTASASIPGAFPPRFFDVEVDGARYREMHVDGGIANSVFIAPRWFRSDQFSPTKITGGVNVYVIQNNKVVPDYGPAEDRLVSIAGDSISELIRNQSQGDLLRIYAIAERRGFAFRLATVPTSFDQASDEGFDPVYMSALYDVGYTTGRDATAWVDRPPNLPAVFDEPGFAGVFAAQPLTGRSASSAPEAGPGSVRPRRQ